MNTKRKNGERFFKELYHERQVRESMEVVEHRLAELEDSIGRNLSEVEQMGILDVVDELTPKDKKGDYLYELIPFEYAWDVYQIKRKRMFENFFNQKSP